MADRMLSAFGKYLKILRDRRGLSLSDVSTLTKSYPEPIGKGYLSRVERGLARVGFSKMVALSRAYEVSLDALGEKLALDLEVDELKNAPNTSGKTFGELLEIGLGFNQRGMKWHCYAAIRDALPRAGSDPLHQGNATRREQAVRAVLSHGVAARATGRYSVALNEFRFVMENLDALNVESVSVVFEQTAVVRMRQGELVAAQRLVERAIELAREAPLKRNLGDALATQASVAFSSKNFESSIEGFQAAFAAYKAAGRHVDCARTMNNLARTYFSANRPKAARRALLSADKLATANKAESIRARVRILLGEIESVEGNDRKATERWREALDLARGTRDSAVQFDAEFQLFRQSVQQGNLTMANALGRRLSRMTPWLSRTESDVDEFLQLYEMHRKPKQRGVARTQPAVLVGRNTTPPSVL